MLKYFYEIFEALPRQGPGTDAATLRALAALPDLPPRPRVLDIGCGSGAQTLVLAQALAGEITAVDNHAQFLELLTRRARAAGVGERVHPRMETMSALPFGESSFDLLWAEGSIYNIGFGEGLATWRPMLAPAGYLVASEVAWRTPRPPPEAAEFWSTEYPAIAPVEENLSVARKQGYRVVEHFPLEREGWWEQYYRPLAQQTAALRRKYARDATAQEVCDTLDAEISMFERHGDSYGYEFFALQKT